MNIFYDAPWGTGLLVASLLATIICLGAGGFLILYGRRIKRLSRLGGRVCQAVGVIEIGILIPFALFTVRGYTVTPDEIQVHRLIWKTNIPLTGLQSIEAEPNVMRGSIRTAGNGGFFAYSGQWKNQILGNYQVLATDKERTVILQYETETYVLSPADPAGFAREVRTKLNIEPRS